jgi:CBS domain-containing protein
MGGLQSRVRAAPPRDTRPGAPYLRRASRAAVDSGARSGAAAGGAGDERLVGLLTHRRVLEAWVSQGHPDREDPAVVARDVPVEMIMEKDVMTVQPQTRASRAASLLEKHKFGCLPVVERGRLVGIVTEADFVRVARRFLEREAKAAIAS